MEDLRNNLIRRELGGRAAFGRANGSPYPRVVLAKSAQREQKKGDGRNCELKRVRKVLKIKSDVFVAGLFAAGLLAHGLLEHRQRSEVVDGRGKAGATRRPAWGK